MGHLGTSWYLDASTRWSHICLLSTRNHAFARFIAHFIKLRAHYPNNPIKFIRMDNTADFFLKSPQWLLWLLALMWNIRYFTYIYKIDFESLIKRVKLIARLLLQNCKLPTSYWDHAVLHATGLIQIRPTAYHTVSPLQLVRVNQPSNSHLRNSVALYTYWFHHRSIHQWAPIEN